MAAVQRLGTLLLLPDCGLPDRVGGRVHLALQRVKAGWKSAGVSVLRSDMEAHEAIPIATVVPFSGLSLCYSFFNSYKARRHEAIEPLSVCNSTMRRLRRIVTPAVGLLGTLSLAWIALQQERSELSTALY